MIAPHMYIINMQAMQGMQAMQDSQSPCQAGLRLASEAKRASVQWASDDHAVWQVAGTHGCKFHQVSEDMTGSYI